MIPARRPIPTRLSPRLVEILARMAEAKLAADGCAGPAQRSIVSRGVAPRNDGRHDAR